MPHFIKIDDEDSVRIENKYAWKRKVGTQVKKIIISRSSKDGLDEGIDILSDLNAALNKQNFSKLGEVTNLEELSVVNVELSIKDIESLCISISSLNNLKLLKLVNCSLTDDAIKTISSKLLSSNSNIEVIDLSSNIITNKGLFSLHASITSNHQSAISEIGLARTKIKDFTASSRIKNEIGMIGFFESLADLARDKKNGPKTHIKKVSFADSEYISPDGVRKALNAIERNKYLFEVDITKDSMPVELVATVNNKCQFHRDVMILGDSDNVHDQ